MFSMSHCENTSTYNTHNFSLHHNKFIIYILYPSKILLARCCCCWTLYGSFAADIVSPSLVLCSLCYTKPHKTRFYDTLKTQQNQAVLQNEVELQNEVLQNPDAGVLLSLRRMSTLLCCSLYGTTHPPLKGFVTTPKSLMYY